MLNIYDYIKKINVLDFYSGELEITVSSKLFKINIYVFELNNKNEFKFLYKHIYDENILTYTMLLEHIYTNSKAEHFQLLFINPFTFKKNRVNKIDDKSPKNIQKSIKLLTI